MHFLCSILLLYILLQMIAGEWILIDRVNEMNLKRFALVDKADPSEVLMITVHIKPNNANDLEKILEDVSNPSSPNYGKHLRKEEIDKIIKNEAGEKAVEEYFKNFEHLSMSFGRNGAQLSISLPVSSLSLALNTEFNVYHDKSGKKYTRASKYYLPDHVAQYVEHISNVSQFPIEVHHGPVIVEKEISA